MNKEDEHNIRKLLSVTDGETAVWLQEKIKNLSLTMLYYKCAMMEIETKLNVLNENFALKYNRNPISSIKTRLKSLHSIGNKMERKGVPVTQESIVEALNDVAGVRVICPFPKDVYTIANALLKQDDLKLIQQKDYIKNPKENGYRSLHLIVETPIFLENEKRLVKVEIQIRTIAMDFWASLEHQMNYKKDYVCSKEMSQELLECAQLSASLDMRMEQLLNNIESDSDL